MNKENNQSAAGLRRSAIAERIRLREEWSALKGTKAQEAATRPQTKVLTQKVTNVKATTRGGLKQTGGYNKEITCTTRQATNVANDTLRGVVALVCVGAETRALPLRAALCALGATVLPTWSPHVTHVVWTQGGCRATRAKARALACRLVSPLWVEACAAASRRLPEQAFPAPARASDLPSPTTLRRLLKKAEAENIDITGLLSDSNDDKDKPMRLRISSEHDSSTDTSHDTSRDTSHDSAGIESRVNTAPRRALPKVSESVSPVRPARSRRKLFTQKEAETTRDSDESDDTINPKPSKPTMNPPSKPPPKRQAKAAQPQKLTQKDRKELARAERMARRILAGCTPAATATQCSRRSVQPRIVLTGMTRPERRAVTAGVRSLHGKLQSAVDRRTTHVLLGSCGQQDDHQNGITGTTNLTPDTSRFIHRSELQKARTLNALAGAARGCRVLYAQWVTDSVDSKKWLHHSGYEVPHLKKISQKARVERAALNLLRSEYAYDVFSGMRVYITPNAAQRDAAIELLTLCGAVVVNNKENVLINGERNERNDRNKTGLTQNNGKIPFDSLTQRSTALFGDNKRLGRIDEDGITQKSNGIKLSAFTQRGRRIQNGVNRNGGGTQYGGQIQDGVDENRLISEYDVKIGSENGQICSKWVFDSVAAARMRTARRYVVSDVSNSDSQVMEV